MATGEEETRIGDGTSGGEEETMIGESFDRMLFIEASADRLLTGKRPSPVLKLRRR